MGFQAGLVMSGTFLKSETNREYVSIFFKYMNSALTNFLKVTLMSAATVKKTPFLPSRKRNLVTNTMPANKRKKYPHPHFASGEPEQRRMRPGSKAFCCSIHISTHEPPLASTTLDVLMWNSWTADWERRSKAGL